jgi:hypothetical protein
VNKLNAVVFYCLLSCNWVLNEAGTLESSSMLIYSHSEKSIYTWRDRHGAILITTVINLVSQLNEISKVTE